ncbi:hypothetical protein SAMN04488078_1003100 [Antarctobacter heliothermus]|uniref:Uncharacterized protein n=2 Tax=Antarctobacter heliothermus TaxID=74033 RepID=A0A239BIB5_9RHOB|nr:hypothetical protein SAMN04488078_1003100 [Antarctobacter heliothermus]
MRLILVLVLTGLLAVLSLPGAAAAHDVSGVTMSDHMTGCPDCPETAGGPGVDHDCPHVTGCGAMVMLGSAVLPAMIAPQGEPHDPVGANLANGIRPRIDLPPPRLIA